METAIDHNETTNNLAGAGRAFLAVCNAGACGESFGADTMNIVNTGKWCQVALPTGESAIRNITSILRRFGFVVKTFNMGQQITSVGSVKLTMIDIRPGSNSDTCVIGDVSVNDIIESHAGYIGAF
jgi:hypothetical protein